MCKELCVHAQVHAHRIVQPWHLQIPHARHVLGKKIQLLVASPHHLLFQNSIKVLLSNHQDIAIRLAPARCRHRVGPGGRRRGWGKINWEGDKHKCETRPHQTRQKPDILDKNPPYSTRPQLKRTKQSPKRLDKTKQKILDNTHKYHTKEATHINIR